MKQPYLLQTSPDTLILFDNGKDNFLADFHQAFTGCKVESGHENIFALFGTDAFFTVRGGQPALQDWDDKIYFSLPLPFSFGFGRRLRRDAGRHSRTGCHRKAASPV